MKILVFGNVTPCQQLCHEDGKITLTPNVVNYLLCKNLGLHNGESSRTFEVLHDVGRLIATKVSERCSASIFKVKQSTWRKFPEHLIFMTTV